MCPPMMISLLIVVSRIEARRYSARIETRWMIEKRKVKQGRRLVEQVVGGGGRYIDIFIYIYI